MEGSAVPDLVVRSHRGTYAVHFVEGLGGLEKGLREVDHLFIDAKIAALYAKPLAKVLAAPSVLVVEATEKNKSLEKIPDYISHLLDRGVRRNHSLVAVGGGIIQDITAFIS